MPKPKAGSPTSKGKAKQSKAKAGNKAKTSPKTKKEFVPMNEDSSTWTVNLEIQTAKDGRVKFPITGEGRIPTLNGVKIDNGHNKMQNWLYFCIDKFTPVKGDKDDYHVRVNRHDDLRAAQKDAILINLRRIMKAKIREINNAVTEKEKAENAAIRKMEREKTAARNASLKAKSPKAKSPKAQSPKAKSPKAKASAK